MNKRSNSEGTITKVGRDRWRVITPRRAGIKPVSRTITGSKADARVALRQLIEDQTGVDRLSRRNVTVSSFFVEYLEQIRETRARKTHAQYDSIYRVHIADQLGRLLLSDLNSLIVGNWLRSLKSGKHARHVAFRLLRGAMNVAITQRLITHNPTDGIESPKVPSSNPDPFTESEARTIVKSEPSSPWYLYVRLGFGTALRGGELQGLQWRDLDVDDRTINVRRQLVELAGQQHVGPLKTASSQRTVPVPDDLIDELLQRRRDAMRYGQAGDECHVFARPDGKQDSRSSFGQRKWRSLLKACQIRHRGFHHVRHTWATMQISIGTPLPLISAVLGHRKVSTTLDIYARWLPADVEKAREVGRKLFA